MSQPPPHDSDPGARRDISPDSTHVRMTLSRFIAVSVSIAVAVGAFSGTYWSLLGHTSNHHIHLPEDFELKHGAPVGDRDLELSKESTAQAVDAIVKVHIGELEKSINAGRHK